MNMTTMLWELGQDQCVNYKMRCRLRPCTSAQGVFCCRECDYIKCTSKYKIKDDKHERQRYTVTNNL